MPSSFCAWHAWIKKEEKSKSNELFRGEIGDVFAFDLSALFLAYRFLTTLLHLKRDKSSFQRVNAKHKNVHEWKTSRKYLEIYDARSSAKSHSAELQSSISGI